MTSTWKSEYRYQQKHQQNSWLVNPSLPRTRTFFGELVFHHSPSSPKNNCVGGYVNPFLFSDRTSRLTTLITFNESQSKCIQKSCLLRNQNYLYAFRLKYLVWRKNHLPKKKEQLRTLLFDLRNQLSRHALKARMRAFIRGLIASIIPKWLDKTLQIEVHCFKKRQWRAQD